MHTSIGNFDYIIVGAGSAGCVVANRLSQNPENSVLLLEAGGSDNYHWIHIPVGYLYCMGNPRTDWGYKTADEPGLNGRSLDYPRGRVMGGCSSINGMIYMRGQARDYDLWRQMGNTGWGWDDVLPYFMKSENQTAIEPGNTHGTGGEWQVENQRLSWEILDSFIEAANQAGIPTTDDFNSGNNEGVGYFHVNQKRGIRWNTSKAFLRPIRNRKNLTIIKHAHVEKLSLQGKRAEKVLFTCKGQQVAASARGELILCAGAIGSPQILQLSGIGPGELLSSNDISIEHPLPGVGENLQDHLQIRCAYKVSNTKTLNSRANSLIGKMGIALEYLFNQSGPMSMSPSQLGCFVKSDASRDTPDLEYHIQPLSLDKFGEPLHAFDALTASICNLRPESRGHVRIVDSHPQTHPEIQPNYLSTESDRQTAARAVKITRHIMSQPALNKYFPEEFKPGLEYQTEEELVRLAGDIATTIFHPVGTCKMGMDSHAVVDSELRVHGIQGLRVVDASIMPVITSGNTNAPTIMIAEKAADMILGA